MNFIAKSQDFIKDTNSYKYIKEGSYSKAASDYELFMSSLWKYKYTISTGITLLYASKHIATSLINFGFLCGDAAVWAGTKITQSIKWVGRQAGWVQEQRENQEKSKFKYFYDKMRKNIYPGKKDLLPIEIQKLFLINPEKKIINIDINLLENIAKKIETFDESIIIKKYLDPKDQNINPEFTNILRIAFFFFMKLRQNYKNRDDELINLLLENSTKEQQQKTLYLMYYNHEKDRENEKDLDPLSSEAKQVLLLARNSYEYLYLGSILNLKDFVNFDNWIINFPKTITEFYESAKFSVQDSTRNFFKNLAFNK